MGPQSSWDPLSATDVLLTCKVPQGPAWQGPWVEILGCSLSELPPTTTRFYSLSRAGHSSLKQYAGSGGL